MYYGYGSGNNNNSISPLKVALYAGIAIVVIILAFVFAGKMGGGKKSFTVTFMDADGVYKIVENVKKGTTVDAPIPPVKVEYKFLGWYLDDTLYDFSTPITSDVYLKAKWLNTSTNKIEQIDKDKENEIKNNPTPTATPEPTATPKTTATPKPTQKSNTNKNRKSYTITVIGGEGSGTYPEGTVIVIKANQGGTTESDWQGNTAEAAGNVKYRLEIKTNFTHWNDGNQDVERHISVQGNATYTAEYETTTREIDKWEYKKEAIYGYPTYLQYSYTNTLGLYAFGNLSSSGYASVCRKNSTNCRCYKEDSGGTINFHSSATWDISYDHGTGIVNLVGGTSGTSRTVKVQVAYAKNETLAKPTTVDIQDKCDKKIVSKTGVLLEYKPCTSASTTCGYTENGEEYCVSSCQESYDDGIYLMDTSYKGSKKVKLSIQMPTVLTGYNAGWQQIQ